MSEAVTDLALASVTPGQLAWRRFKRHRLAYASGIFLIVIYFVAVFCEFFAPYSTDTRNVQAVNAPPMAVRFFDVDGKFHIRPFVY